MQSSFSKASFASHIAPSLWSTAQNTSKMVWRQRSMKINDQTLVFLHEESVRTFQKIWGMISVKCLCSNKDSRTNLRVCVCLWDRGVCEEKQIYWMVSDRLKWPERETFVLQRPRYIKDMEQNMLVSINQCQVQCKMQYNTNTQRISTGERHYRAADRTR